MTLSFILVSVAITCTGMACMHVAEQWIDKCYFGSLKRRIAFGICLWLGGAAITVSGITSIMAEIAGRLR